MSLGSFFRKLPFPFSPDLRIPIPCLSAGQCQPVGAHCSLGLELLFSHLQAFASAMPLSGPPLPPLPCLVPEENERGLERGSVVSRACGETGTLHLFRSSTPQDILLLRSCPQKDSSWGQIQGLCQPYSTSFILSCANPRKGCPSCTVFMFLKVLLRYSLYNIKFIHYHIRF